MPRSPDIVEAQEAIIDPISAAPRGSRRGTADEEGVCLEDEDVVCTGISQSGGDEGGGGN